MTQLLSRRRLLGTMSLAAAAGGAAVLAGCAPATLGTPTVPADETPLTTPEAPTTPAATAETPSAAETPAATPAAAAPGTQITTPTTVRVWGFGLDDAFARARVAVFQDLQPNVTLEPVGGTLNTQQLLTAVASGDPPEVINVDRVDTGSWAARNAIDPIDDLVERDAFDLSVFYPFTLDQVRYQGALYGIPQFVSFDLIYMNNAVLQEAGVDPATVDPGNWEQLQQLGEQLHQRDNGNVTRTGFDTKMQDGRIWLWSWSNGVAEPISADGTTSNFDDPGVLEALIWAKETVDLQGGDQARIAFQQTQNFFSAQNPVIIGQTAMTVFEQWLIGVLAFDPELDFATILPRMRNSEEAVTQASGSAFAIPRGVEGAQRDAAWEFIKGMTSTESWVAGASAAVEARRQEGVPYTPSITANRVADEQIWNEIYEPIGPGFDQTVALFPQALEVARFRYSGPVAAEVNDLMLSEVNDALVGAKTPEQALADLDAAVQEVIDQFAEAPGTR
jgi:multiple sugar transport system substrate-binding protein